MKARKSVRSLEQNLTETIAQSVSKIKPFFLPDLAQFVFFFIYIYRIGYKKRTQLIYLAQLCLGFEKKQYGHLPMLPIQLFKPRQSWSPGPYVRYRIGISQESRTH